MWLPHSRPGRPCFLARSDQGFPRHGGALLREVTQEPSYQIQRPSYRADKSLIYPRTAWPSLLQGGCRFGGKFTLDVSVFVIVPRSWDIRRSGPLRAESQEPRPRFPKQPEAPSHPQRFPTCQGAWGAGNPLPWLLGEFQASPETSAWNPDL